MSSSDCPLKFVSTSEGQTDEFGRVCGAAVLEQLTIALQGELGAGKTRFVRAFCEGLDVDASRVISPTFVLMHLYQGSRWPVSHFDAYRMGDPDEFLAIGADEFLSDPERICLIEWADRVAEVLPPDRVTVEIAQSGRRERRFVLTAGGARSHRFLARLGHLLAAKKQCGKSNGSGAG